MDQIEETRQNTRLADGHTWAGCADDRVRVPKRMRSLSTTGHQSSHRSKYLHAVCVALGKALFRRPSHRLVQLVVSK